MSSAQQFTDAEQDRVCRIADRMAGWTAPIRIKIATLIVRLDRSFGVSRLDRHIETVVEAVCKRRDQDCLRALVRQTMRDAI